MFKKFNYYWALIAIAFSFAFVGCSEDEATAPAIDESAVVLQYLEANGDFINTLAPTIITATDARTALLTDSAKTYFIDIRSAADYAKGHIAGAKNVLLADLLTHFKSIVPTNYNKIIIACYTGQTACYGSSLMRIMGYNNVYALKWGMASWHSDFITSWKSKIGNTRATQFVTDDVAKNAVTTMPVLSTGKTVASEIIEARVKDLLAKGFTEATVTNDAVFTTPSSYYIVNYWPLAQYKDPGHIPGAVQYTPKADFKSTAFLKTLPTNKTVAVYCYTGQTSAFMCAYLRLLGYDAKSVSFGANAMIYDLMAAKTGFTIWKDTECMNYDIVK